MVDYRKDLPPSFYTVISPRWDNLLCPVKLDLNGGDVLHRLSMQAIDWAIKFEKYSQEWFLAREIFRAQLKAHKVGPGNYCRYWQATPLGDWWCGDNVMSRDQSIPMIIAMGMFEMYDELREFKRELERRGYTNTVINNEPGTHKHPDLATPAIWGMIDRALGEKTEWVEIGDRYMLADSKLIEKLANPPWTEWVARDGYYKDSLGIKWPKWKKVKEYAWEPELQGDPVNSTLIHMQSQYHHEMTSTARKARRLYAKRSYYRQTWKNYWIRPKDPQCRFDLLYAPYLDKLGV